MTRELWQFQCALRFLKVVFRQRANDSLILVSLIRIFRDVQVVKRRGNAGFAGRTNSCNYISWIPPDVCHNWSDPSN